MRHKPLAEVEQSESIFTSKAYMRSVFAKDALLNEWTDTVCVNEGVESNTFTQFKINKKKWKECRESHIKQRNIKRWEMQQAWQDFLREQIELEDQLAAEDDRLADELVKARSAIRKFRIKISSRKVYLEHLELTKSYTKIRNALKLPNIRTLTRNKVVPPQPSIKNEEENIPEDK